MEGDFTEHHIELLIDAGRAGKTVKTVLRNELLISSRLLKKMKYSDSILIDGCPVHVIHTLSKGERLTLITELGCEGSDSVTPIEGELDIIMEDDDILALNKGAGIAVHPSQGNRENSLGNIVAGYFAKKGQSLTLRVVNRLDKNTSGLVLMAKNARAAAILNAQMAKSTVYKEYFCIVHGILEEKRGTVDLPIGRKPGSVLEREVSPVGRRAVTRYSVLKERGGLSLLFVTTETGRTHQIRVHMAHLGHPLVGDFLYGREDGILPRHGLHMGHMAFFHPSTGEWTVLSCPMAGDMRDLMDY